MDEQIVDIYDSKAVLRKDELQKLLSFLDTLESEHLADDRKTSPKDLEEAAGEYEKKHTYQRYDGGGLTPEYDATLAESFIAGAKWQEKRNLRFVKQVLSGDFTVFEAGRKYEREQMMEEAVECETVCVKDRLFAVLPVKEFQWTVGDKVRIIIVKEDKK